MPSNEFSVMIVSQAKWFSLFVFCWVWLLPLQASGRLMRQKLSEVRVVCDCSVTALLGGFSGVYEQGVFTAQVRECFSKPF